MAAAVDGALAPDFEAMGIYIDGRTQNELQELLKSKTELFG